MIGGTRGARGKRKKAIGNGQEAIGGKQQAVEGRAMPSGLASNGGKS
jgi:hypothetical protein